MDTVLRAWMFSWRTAFEVAATALALVDGVERYSGPRELAILQCLMERLRFLFLIHGKVLLSRDTLCRALIEVEYIFDLRATAGRQAAANESD